MLRVLRKFMFHKISNNPSKILILFGAFLVNSLWAISYPFSKMLLTSSNLSPMGLSAYRLLISGVILIAFVKKKDVPSKILLKDIWLLISMGTIGVALAFWLQYVGTSLTTASNISLLVCLEPIFIVLLSFVFYKESISKKRLFSLGLAILGSLLISLDPKTLALTEGKYFLGNFLMILSLIGYSLYTVSAKPLTVSWGPSALTAIPFLIASFIFIPFYYFFFRDDFFHSLQLNLNEWAMVLYTSVVATALAYLIWNWILKWLSPTEISYTLFFQPIVGGIASYFMLKEELSFYFFVGGGIICTAILFGDFKNSVLRHKTRGTI